MKKIVNGIFALVVAGVLTAGICCTGFASRDEHGKWFKNGNISTWHWKDKEEEKKPDGENGGDEAAKTSNFIVSDKQERGIALYSTAGKATQGGYYTSHVLTATVTPENADDTYVVWSVAWENPDAEWVLNAEWDEDSEDYVYGDERVVGDYIKITYNDNGVNKDILTSNGACNTVTVEVLQAFGEPIVVTARARMDETKSATVKFGYVKRVETTSFTGTLATTNNILVDGSPLYSFVPQWTLSDGTVDPVVTVSTVTLRLLSDKGALADCRKDYTVDVTTWGANTAWISTKYDNFFTRDVTVAEARDYFKLLENETSPLGIFFTISITGGEKVPDFTITQDSVIAMKGVSADGLTVAVSGVNIDQTGELYF